MPQDRFAMVYNVDLVNNMSEEDSAWDGFIESSRFINWSNIKAVARHCLSAKEFRIFVLRGKRGMTFKQIGTCLNISFQLTHYFYKNSVKKIRKIMQNHLKSEVYIEGCLKSGFKEYVMKEEKVKEKKYAAVCNLCKLRIKKEAWLIRGKIYHVDECADKYISAQGDLNMMKMKVYLA